jgi:hypothetical protein
VVEVSVAVGCPSVLLFASVELDDVGSSEPLPPQAAIDNDIANKITNPRFTAYSFSRCGCCI